MSTAGSGDRSGEGGRAVKITRVQYLAAKALVAMLRAADEDVDPKYVRMASASIVAGGQR